ncbi:hypothetical protein SEUCBS140593_003690 [Sporothrix eucalyptigena]|uniref:Enoyl reductase (ER) domain-containing protein n=1 Tax=Sporothrix eucalyptigena TaxID=1812306 RepID=A0ABP0BGX0_9PEZI
MPEKTNIAALLPGVGKDLELAAQPIPTPGPKDVLIRSHAIPINPVDRARQLTGYTLKSFPAILGTDLAGVVEAIGSDVTDLKAGDRVLATVDGIITGDKSREAFQTYTVARASTTAKLPDSVSFVEGSTIGVAIVTAAMIFFDGFKFQIPGSEASADFRPLPTAGEAPIVVIWGGASNIGLVTIQLAKILGFTVYATASQQHHAKLQKLGANVMVDYADADAAVEHFVAAAKKAGKQILYAVDTINKLEKTTPFVQQALLKSAAATPSPAKAGLVYINRIEYGWDESIEARFITATDVWERRFDIGHWIFTSGNLTRWLADGTFAPPPARVLPGGLAALNEGLVLIKGGGVHGEKLVVEVE